MLILNEKQYAEDLLIGKNKNIKSLRVKIDLITRYYYHVLHLSSNDNYDKTVLWLNQNQDNFCECNYSKFIECNIKKASKKPFYLIESIKITRQEIDIIKSLDNLRYQKVLFVMLCAAKVQKISDGYSNGFTNISITDIYKMARVSIPAQDREYLLHHLLIKGLIKKPQKNDSKGIFVCFISEDEGDIALELKECDFKELAYTYLSWLDNGVGYLKCKKCGCTIKKHKDIKYCQDCMSSTSDIQRKICIDCGQVYETSMKDTSSCRCIECQEKRNKDMTAERVKRFRDQNM